MEKINVLIEIAQGSNAKLEFDKKLNQIKLDRFLYGANVYPGDYGFIPETLELDGDPVDVIVFSQHSLFPGCWAEVRIIGGLAMVDDGEIDNKLIGVYVGNPETKAIKDLTAVTEAWKNKVWDFFLNYKNLENKKVSLQKWLNAQQAKQLVIVCQKRYQQKSN